MRRHRASLVEQGIKTDLEDSEESGSGFEDEKMTDPKPNRRSRKRRRLINEDDAEEDLKLSPGQQASLISNSSSKKKRKTVGPVLYTPGELLPELEPQVGDYLHVHVLAQYVTMDNDQVKSNEIWGSNPYTGDSDVVCMLQHSGVYRLGKDIPDFYLLKVMLRVLPGEESYEGVDRNGIKSRDWGSHEISLVPEETEIIQDPDPITQICLGHHALSMVEYQCLEKVGKRTNQTTQQPVKSCSSSSNYEKRGMIGIGGVNHDVHVDDVNSIISVDVLPDTILQFNLSNEVCFQYSLDMIFDRGVHPSQWTSFRFKKATLVLESLNNRYELSLRSYGNNGHYRWARVHSPQKKTLLWCSQNQIPLAEKHLNVIENDVYWSQIIWTDKSVIINHIHYSIHKLYWVEIHPQPLSSPIIPYHNLTGQHSSSHITS